MRSETLQNDGSAYPVNVTQDDDGSIALTQPSARGKKHPLDYIQMSRQDAWELRNLLNAWFDTNTEQPIG